ncbi:alcohol acyltransferase 9 [Andrographis paniculata]|uniref:alcohol acyltransferase 9 n=1 Tax=Andrographis paniculata TaxID=175694 RepID=UPI0021E8C870|nr:alcohol acyltransferase 9 [Andrographis paniculata]
MSSSGSVCVKEAVLIPPSEPTPNHTLRLSALDSQLFLRFTFEYLLVYEPRASVDRAALAQNCKAGLGRALVPYYPLAGRVRKRPEGGGLEVVCRAQGAVFIEAVSGSTVAEFAGAPRRGGAQWRKLLSVHVEDVLQGAPPLVVQMTWLSDGGAALAAGFNHCLCDGVGSGEFLKVFAELAAGESGISELNPQPTWNRHLLDPPSPIRSGRVNFKPGSHPEFRPVPDVSEFAARYAEERMIPTCITYDENGIKDLKKLSRSPPAQTTSFEAVAGHVWRSWSRSLRLPANQIVKLLFTINVRQRVSPNLPSGYYGNAIVLGCAEARAADLAEKGLEHAAELVRRAKERVGDAYVREVVECVSSGGGAGIVDLVGALVLTQWTTLGLDTLDFGMGRPLHVGPLCYDRYCMLSPAPATGRRRAVKVSLAVPATAVDDYLYFLRNPQRQCQRR